MSRVEWPEPLQKLYRQRWRIWFVAILAHTIGIFHRAAMAPVADRLMADFNISAVAFGGLGAVYFYTYAAMQLPSGALADTVGPRKTVTLGLLLATLGSIVMGLAPSFGVVYAGRFLVSVGVSVAWLSAVRVMMEWFRTRELGSVMGMCGTIANLGGVAAATPLALVVMWVGWRMSFVAIAGVSFAMAAAYWLIVRDSPARVGLPPVAELDGHNVPSAPAFGDSSSLSLARKARIVFSNRQIWLLFLVEFGLYGSFTTLIHNWVVVYAMQTYGLHRDLAANFVLVATVGIMVGAPAVGFFSDRISRRRLPIVVFAGFSLASFLVLVLWNSGRPPLGALYPLCFFIGFGGGAVPVVFACVRDVAQPSVRGMASGLVNSGGFVAAAIAQPMFGYVLDLGWQGEMMEGARAYPLAAFQQGLLLCCALAALGFIGALLLRETHSRDSYRPQS